jgi:hypothetical protein
MLPNLMEEKSVAPEESDMTNHDLLETKYGILGLIEERSPAICMSCIL